jgi:hypothetical protein
MVVFGLPGKEKSTLLNYLRDGNDLVDYFKTGRSEKAVTTVAS